MSKPVAILITLILVVGLLFVIYSAMTHFSQVVIGGKTFFVDVAATQYSQDKGLSGRESLAPNQGLLFVFPVESKYGFWMKDMKFSIDIIWLDSDGRIVHIEKSLSPETYPKIFKPTAPAKYVLEIPAGESDQLNLKIGDSAQIFLK